MRKLLHLKRLVLIIAALIVLTPLGWLNYQLHHSGRIEPAIAQLAFLADSLQSGGAERMQELFPEGYVFTWALYGLASANVARALPINDPRRHSALNAAHQAIVRLDSDQARSTFIAGMDPPYGAFYSSWSLFLRSSLLRVDPDSLDLPTFTRDCDRFAAALDANPSPFLPSYPGSAWPADTAVGISALAVSDSVLGPRYQRVIKNWLNAVKSRLDPALGGVPHAVDAETGFPEGGCRGESLALVSCVLSELNSDFSRQQYEVLRGNFFDSRLGGIGLREYPRGVEGMADVDSGPLFLGFSGPATVVGIGAAIRHGDQALATDLLSMAEAVGGPFEWAGRRRYAAGLIPVGEAFLAWARTSAPGQGDFHSLTPAAWRWRLHFASALLGGAVASVFYRLLKPQRIP